MKIIKEYDELTLDEIKTVIEIKKTFDLISQLYGKLTPFNEALKNIKFEENTRNNHITILVNNEYMKFEVCLPKNEFYFFNNLTNSDQMELVKSLIDKTKRMENKA